MPSASRLIPLGLALVGLFAGVGPAAAKPPRAGQAIHRPKPVLKGRLIRTVPARVTMFYSFKDKKTGRLHPMAAVSKTVVVKVVKPSAGKAHPGRPRRKG